MRRRGMFMNSVNIDLIPYLIAGYEFIVNANDLTGNHNGVSAGIKYYGTGTATFNGVNYITVPDDDELSFTDGLGDLPFSVTIKFKPTASDGYRMLLWKGGGGTDREYRFQIGLGRIQVTLMNPTTDTLSLFSVGSVNLNAENTLVFTYDGSKTIGGLRLILNGVENNTDVSVGNYTGMVNSTYDATIGSRSDNLGANMFEGEMSSLYIFNRVITDSEISYITNLMNFNGTLNSYNRILDLYPMEIGYSLRKLNESAVYSVRVRRTGDNAETDVVLPDSGLITLDSLVSAGGTLSNWKGVNDLYVSTLYNQGSNGSTYDLKQTVIAKQPRLEFTLTDAVINFDVGNVILKANTVISDQSGTAFNLWSMLDTNNVSLGHADTATNNLFELQLLLSQSLVNYSSRVVTTLPVAQIENGIVDTRTSYGPITVRNNGSNSSVSYNNGVLNQMNVYGGTPGRWFGDTVGGSQQLQMGAIERVSPFYAGGKFSEVLYTGALVDSTNINTINGDIISGYNKYLFDTQPAKIGYSLRKLSSTQIYGIRVRRSSDNAETDVVLPEMGKIGARSLVSAGGDLSTWKGVSTLYVTKIYNQGNGGSGFDMYQTTITRQPSLSNSDGIFGYIDFSIGDVGLITTDKLTDTDGHIFSLYSSDDVDSRVFIQASPTTATFNLSYGYLITPDWDNSVRFGGRTNDIIGTLHYKGETSLVGLYEPVSWSRTDAGFKYSVGLDTPAFAVKQIGVDNIYQWYGDVEAIDSVLGLGVLLRASPIYYNFEFNELIYYDSEQTDANEKLIKLNMRRNYGI